MSTIKAYVILLYIYVNNLSIINYDYKIVEDVAIDNEYQMWNA